MTSGFGVNASANGLSGTSAEDIRRIWNGIYTEGIISGATVTTSASALQYTVAAGVVALRVATTEIILVPVPATTVSTTAPTSGSRTDIIYVQQRYPSVEGDAEVVVGVAEVLPTRAFAIARYVVSAGATNTNSAVKTGNISYSIPYGAKMARIHYFQITTTGRAGYLPNSLTRFGHKTFYLPTDRRVKFSVNAVVSAEGAVGFDNSKYCEYGFLPNVDGSDFVLWNTNGLHQAWQSVSYSKTVDLLAGTHTANLGLLKMKGPGMVLGHFGADLDGYGRSGVEFIIEDDGPII